MGKIHNNNKTKDWRVAPLCHPQHPSLLGVFFCPWQKRIYLVCWHPPKFGANMSRYARTPHSTQSSASEPSNASASSAVRPKSKSFAERMHKETIASQPVAVDELDDATPSTRPSSAPPVDASVSNNPATLWGFSADLEVPQQWNVMDCPKCCKKNPQCNSVQMEHTGAFFCSECGFHGNVTLHPRNYRETWVSIWRRFITDPSRAKLPPDNVAADTIGSWAPSWENKEWKERWHSWCVTNDRGEDRLEDAFIYNNDLICWYRPNFTVATPYGLKDLQGTRVVLTTHMEDLAAMKEAGVKGIVCLPPDLDAALSTAPAWRVLESMENMEKNRANNKQDDIKEIVLALRSTPGQRALEDELGRRLNRERCYRVRWRPDDEEVVEEESGPIEVLNNYGPAALELMVEIAPPFPVVGVYELQDIEDKFDELYNTGLVPGSSTGWPSVDNLYTVKTGQWTAVTGIPGHGKSSWLDGLLVNLASLHGWRFGLFSPENQPVERHFASLMEKKLKKPFSEGPTPRITEVEKNRTKRWLNDRFKVILPDEENGVWTLEAVLDLAKTLVYRYGIRGLVIDPWNELDHSRSSALNETSHISESLTKIRRFARLYDVHIWIVAHPTKLEKKANGKYPVATPYDISGGAHWRNKADNALSIYRNVGEADDDVCDIYVQKIRFKEVGRVGMTSIRSEKASGSYVDDIDHAKRNIALVKGEHFPSNTMQTTERVYTPHGEPLEYDHSF